MSTKLGVALSRPIRDWTELKPLRPGRNPKLAAIHETALFAMRGNPMSSVEADQPAAHNSAHNAVDAVQCRVVSKCICAQHTPANRQQMAGAMVAKFGPATKG
jgi:hypothetical protein